MGITEKGNKVILIITSCFYPNQVITDFDSKIDSLEKRINRYIYAIETMDFEIFDNVFFIDNSGYSFKDFPLLSDILDQKKIKKVKFSPSAISFSKGKGFQECEMINFILEKYKDDTNFLKITGTIPLENLQYLINSFKKRFKNKEAKIFSTYISNLERKIDSRFFYTNKKTWKSFSLNYQKFISDKNNFYLEHALYIFCKMTKVKIILFYPKIGKKVFYQGNGNKFKTFKINYFLNKLIFK